MNQKNKHKLVSDPRTAAIPRIISMNLSPKR